MRRKERAEGEVFVSGLARLMCTASSTYSYDDEGDLMVSALVLIAVTVIGLAAAYGIATIR